MRRWGNPTTALLLIVVSLVGCGQRGRPSVRVALAGAQIPLELVESWLQEARDPTFFVERVEPVYLSMHGFQRLREGQCDLACTDRPLSATEAAEWAAPANAERGDAPRDPAVAAASPVLAIAGERIAFYGFALYVNTANPLDAMLTRQLRLVYQRRVKDWSELAGPALPTCTGPINLYGPEKSTRGGDVLAPLANVWFADATWKVCPSDAAVVAQVAKDPLGLGFASIGYDDAGVRYLGLRYEASARPILPSIDDIEADRYDLARVIYVYYATPPAPAVQAALDFLHSPSGSRAIERTQLWPVAPERADVPLPGPPSNAASSRETPANSASGASG